MTVAIPTLVVILSFAVSAQAANYYSVRNQLISARRRRIDDKIKTLFEEWTARRGKIYNEIEEKDRRFEVFKDNLKFVDDHNGDNGNRTYRLGLNKFADLTNEEFRAAYLGTTRRADAERQFMRGSQPQASRGVDGLPEYVDWREMAAVKDQWTCDGYEDAPQNEKALQNTLTHQPICVAIEASGRALQLYSSGVFTGECGTHLDHGMVVVGYGSESEVDYWIVKNSWGADWGENGYLNLHEMLIVLVENVGLLWEFLIPLRKVKIHQIQKWPMPIVRLNEMRLYIYVYNVLRRKDLFQV